jgi:hypothetical protein
MKRKESKSSRMHTTEIAYPLQCKEYKRIVESLYKLHLDKNREYSPNNVKALGTLGLSLRVFEKIIRTLNLLGWDVWEGKPKAAVEDIKFDSVDRELEDVANLAIIGKILLNQKWAR